jgi:serpin B
VQRGNRIVMKTATALWCQQGDPFTSAFLGVARNDYLATLEQANFAHDAESARRAVNGWIARSTGGRFSEQVRAGQFTADTSLVVCNAIYFKGRWASPFKRGATTQAPFYLSKDRSVAVPMMKKKANFKTCYLQGVGAKLLELPYFGRDLSMIVILPDDVEGLTELESYFTAENLRGWLKQLDETSLRETVIELPRFSTEQQLDLATWLKALGITAAFDRETADFSGIDGKNNLYLSAALHGAVVEVNEEGTEAAAVTLVHVTARSMANRFIADHPFTFLVRDNGSGAILFLGRLVDPARQ